MRAEDYQRRREELAGWPVGIVSYKLGDRYVCEIDNVSPGARVARARAHPRRGRARGDGGRRAPPRTRARADPGVPSSRRPRQLARGSRASTRMALAQPGTWSGVAGAASWRAFAAGMVDDWPCAWQPRPTHSSLESGELVIYSTRRR